MYSYQTKTDKIFHSVPLVHFLSIGLTISTTITMLALAAFGDFSIMWFLLTLVVIILGLFETIIALRLGFDSRLLHQVFQDAFSDKKLAILDSALTQLRLMPSHKSGRGLHERLISCIGLFRRQVLLCCFQFITIIGALILITIKF